MNENEQSEIRQFLIKLMKTSGVVWLEYSFLKQSSISLYWLNCWMLKKGGRKIKKGTIPSWSWLTVHFFHLICFDIKCKFYLWSMNHHLNIFMCIFFLIDKLHLLEFILFTDWLITYIPTSNGKVIGFMNYSFVGWRSKSSGGWDDDKNKTGFLTYLVGLPALKKTSSPPTFEETADEGFFFSSLS